MNEPTGTSILQCTDSVNHKPLCILELQQFHFLSGSICSWEMQYLAPKHFPHQHIDFGFCLTLDFLSHCFTYSEQAKNEYIINLYHSFHIMTFSALQVCRLEIKLDAASKKHVHNHSRNERILLIELVVLFEAFRYENKDELWLERITA